MERKVINLAPHNKCTGCAACVDACTKQCISLKEEDLQFFPSINEEECIACGKCMQMCPVLQGKQDVEAFDQTYACAYSKDTDFSSQCTSGGVGSAMAQFAVDNGWYVCGAAFDEDFNLRHIVGNDSDCVNALRGSKYLQSNMQGIYNQITELLKENKRVLFFGTPCQVDALQRYSNKYKENLLTVAILCHGVNSPIVWKNYVAELEKKNKSKLQWYNFRSKEMGGWGELAIAMKFENGKRKKEYAYSNQFHVWFGKHYILRESCFQCAFRVEQRTADITIGDFWGIELILPQLDTRNGVSVVICSTQKGVQFFSSLNNVERIEVNQQKTPSVLKGFLSKAKPETVALQINKRKEFTDYYKSHSFVNVCRKYPSTSKWQHYLQAVKVRLHLSK